MKAVERVKYGERGQGSLIRRQGSMVWLFAYCAQGREHEESTKTTDLKAAKRWAKDKVQKLGKASQEGRRVLSPLAQRVTVGELLEALLADYRIRNVKGLAPVLSHVKPVIERFGDIRAKDLTGRLVDRYVEEQRAAKVADATINRRLQLLRQAFGMEIKRDEARVASVPTIRRLPENNRREGFLEPAEFTAITAGLPAVMADFVGFGYLTAWRPGDLKALRWSMVDMQAGTIRLPDSKNGQGKSLAIVGDLVGIMQRREQARLLTTPSGDVRVVDHVFHRDGRPIADYRDCWFQACKAAGFTYLDPTKTDPKTGKGRERVSKLLYDGKRSAIRNMIRNSVPERVALDVAGIKTRSVLDRYNISSDLDKRSALRAVCLPVPEPAR